MPLVFEIFISFQCFALERISGRSCVPERWSVQGRDSHTEAWEPGITRRSRERRPSTLRYVFKSHVGCAPRTIILKKSVKFNPTK